MMIVAEGGGKTNRETGSVSNADSNEPVRICDINQVRRRQPPLRAVSKDQVTIGKIVDEVGRRATDTWSRPSWWNLIVILPWVIAIIVFIRDWKVDRDIATREQTTQGVITTHEPANHDRYGYIFFADGKKFAGWESPGKDGLEIGKQIIVYYDPLDPRKNALTEFRNLGRNSLGPVPMMLIGIGVVAWFIGTRRRKDLSNSNQTPAPLAPSSS